MPPQPPTHGLVLQPRDYAILTALTTHRYLRSDHIHALLFPESSWRVVQRRMRLLWQHQLVDRLFVPAVLDGRHQPLIPPRQPIYTLTTKGAELVAERASPVGDADRIPHLRPFERPSALQTLEHNLVVSEFMVALTVACRQRPDLTLGRLDHEWALWQALVARKKEREGIIVPDGAFTIRQPGGPAVSFALEIVRAGTRGGNQRLRAKLARYAELNRTGFFRDTYGYERLRAVLVLTTSDARRESLRAVASTLPHSRSLFWFASYLSPAQDRFAIAAGHIFSNSWSTAAGERISLAAALGLENTRVHAPPPNTPAPPVRRSPDSRRDNLPPRTPPLRPPAG